jgi:hypothetical protein
MRWNNYVNSAQQGMTQRYAARLRARQAMLVRDQDAIQDRLRNHPNQLDITDGDALNVLLEVLLNPATADRSLRMIRTPLRPEVIRDIPFEYASEAMTVCLDRITMDDQWPLALRAEAFRPNREALRKAVAAALEEDKAGNLEPETIEKVQSAIDELRVKFEKDVKPDSPDYVPAQDTIKAMAGLTKMLYSPQIEKVLAELDDYQGTTLGDLLGFMQAFNLRFAPANSFRQRRIYLKLYPMMAEQVSGSLGTAAGAVRTVEKAGGEAVKTAENLGGDAVGAMKSAAVDLFKHMKMW